MMLDAIYILATAKLAGSHVALHDVHAVLLIEGDPRYFIEAHHVVLAHQATLSSGVVHEHLGDSRLATPDEVRIGRDLLKEVT